MTNSEIQIYQTNDGKTEIQVKLENETVWLSQEQLSELYQRDRSVITKHISNIFKEGELDKASNVQKMHIANSDKPVKYYNLNVIISLGYRVKSIRGTQFRIWANNILKDFLIKGYALNEQRLLQQKQKFAELKESIKILSEVLISKELSNDESKGLLTIITDYSYALEILDQYDYQTLKVVETSGKETYQLTYKEAINKIKIVKKKFGNSNLFGHEKDASFQSSVSTIYQTFDGIDLYPSVEEKAANLLYFITKNHSFSDGNKRIAAFLFLYFLERNGILFDKIGRKRLADNALVALTLMIAVSKPDEKETMINVVVNLINRKN